MIFNVAFQPRNSKNNDTLVIFVYPIYILV